jgi:hypothetical protein
VIVSGVSEDGLKPFIIKFDILKGTSILKILSSKKEG